MVARPLELLLSHCDRSLVPRTRAHRLAPGLIDERAPSLYVKREDEAGFAIAGGKKRKYASVVNALERMGADVAVAVGGFASNNILGLAQVLLERGIELFTLEKEISLGYFRGNEILTELLLPPERRILVSHADWDHVERIGQELVDKLALEGRRAMLVPEGAFCPEALPGAMTLLWDILENESELGVVFDHIVVDAGSGFTAAALCVANALLGEPKEVHVVLNAPKEPQLRRAVSACLRWGEQLFDRRLDEPKRLVCHAPSHTARYGDVNDAVLRAMVRVARRSGLLTDPIYSAVLFLEAERIVREHAREGRVLLVHSGGATAAYGYGTELRRLCAEPSAARGGSRHGADGPTPSTPDGRGDATAERALLPADPTLKEVD